MAEEFVVEDHKLTQVLAQLLNFLQNFLILELPVLMQLEYGKVIEAPDIERKVQLLHNPRLHLHQILLIDLLMHNLLKDCLHLKRVHFVHLSGDEHADDSDYVQLSDGQARVLGFEVLVHQIDAGEVSLRVEFVRTDDFYHPIQHPRAQILVDVVFVEERTHDLLACLSLLDDVGGVKKAVLLGIGQLNDRLELILQLFTLRNRPDLFTILHQPDLP